MNTLLSGSFSFLVFLCIVGIALNWSYRALIRRRETADAPAQPTLSDPYLIACLRDGDKEALRVAVVALIDRGLIKATGAQLKTRDADAVNLVNRPIERAVLRHFLVSRDADSVLIAAEAVNACAAYRKVLEQHQLLASPQIYAQRVAPLLVALAIVFAICGVRIAYAFAEGRRNVGFLIVLAAVIGVELIIAYRTRLTGLGAEKLDDLKRLFARLKDRAATLSAGGKTNEAALVAAVFGLAALPAMSFPFVERLYPRKTKTDDSGSSSCGSSSSCSSDSSCGGGGGCGGGD
jgi:uncharacterized protein (TIGR04222 family)